MTDFVLTRAPRRLPLLGHLVPLARTPLDFFRSLSAKGDIVTFGLGPVTAYYIGHPDLVRAMLVKDARKFEKGVQFDNVRPLLGDSVLTSSEPKHLRLRRLVRPAFHRTEVAHYAECMREIATERIDTWHRGTDLAIDREFHIITMRIVARSLFSADFDGSFAAEVLTSLPPYLAGLTRRMLVTSKVLQQLPTKSNRDFDTARTRLTAALRHIIMTCRVDTTDRQDLLTMLANARDEEDGSGMSDQQLFDEAMTMLMAGTETVANALSWTCHFLSVHPDIQKRLAEEVLGTLAGREPTFHDLPSLPYTRQVLSEAMRLFPPIWLVSRRPIDDVVLGGHRIPAGRQIFFSPYALQRDAAVYPEPDRFEPDRWAGADVRMTASYLPFGAGIRGCVGEGFAWAEMMLILVSLISRWSLSPVDDHPVRPAAIGTLHPSELHLRLDAR